MCGVAGLIGRLDERDRDRLTAMTNRVRHRGPDGSGRHVVADSRGSVMLGHRRLAIIDIRRIADQPLVDATTGSVLVFNGEIYNFRQLRDELQKEGRVFRTEGDSEVILQGYLAWGIGVVRRLRGMFAFALYDPRSCETLLARDGLGIKPLYYARSADRLLFASEVRALLASNLIAPHVDRLQVPQYLWNGFVAGPQTLVAGVLELPAGTHATVSLEQLEVEPVRYWSPGAVRPPQGQSAANVVAAITRSVELHLQADVPLGVFLSGGLDSTAVAALAARHRPDLQTLCIGSDDARTNESHIAAAVADRLGTNHTTVIIRPETMISDIDEALASFDQPTMDGVNSWFVSRAAHEQGWKVALAGTGGDELFGGYTSFRRLPHLMRALARMPRVACSTGARLGEAATGRGYGTASKLPDLLTSGGAPVQAYQTLYALFSAGNVRRLTGQEASWGLSPTELVELNRQVAGMSPLQQVSAIEHRMFLGGRLLRDTDAVSMAHSLEVRMPLVDTVLNDIVAGLDDDGRFRPIGRKPLLHRIAVEVAGEDLFARRKQGFVLPFESWLRGPLRDVVERTLTDASLVCAAGLKVEATTSLWRRFLAKPDGIYWTRIWALFVLARWCAINDLVAL